MCAFCQHISRTSKGDGRIAYSFIRSERTDPDTGRLAPSAFDATHTLNLVVNRGVGEWLDLGVAYRAATGVPFTPITGAAFDETRDLWQPVHGSEAARTAFERALELEPGYMWVRDVLLPGLG